MTGNPKAQKDRSYVPGPPRLQPRPTAASMARAARYAANRNLPLQTPQRQSVTTPNLHSTKVKPFFQHPSKLDSRSDIKVNRNLDKPPEVTPSKQEIDAFVVENITDGVVEATTNRNLNYDGTIAREETNEIDQFETSRSLPQTPKACSRPQTPRSLQSSRPQTPGEISRPITPVRAPHGTPASRPDTPQRPNLTNSARSKLDNTHNLCTPPKTPAKEEDVQKVYSSTLKQFQTMKRDLDLKQQMILELFNNLRGLHERMREEGVDSGEGLQHQELVMFNVADWAADEVAQLCRDAAAAGCVDGAAELLGDMQAFDDRVLSEADGDVTNIPARFADLCLQAFTGRQEILNWVKDVVEDQGNNEESIKRIAEYNERGLELCEALQELKTCAVAAVDTVIEQSRRACQERRALVSVGEALVREVARLSRQLNEVPACIGPQHDHGGLSNMLEDIRQELEEERFARTAAKDKLTATETQLRQARVRIAKMDRQLREAEASIASLTGTVKTLEDQSRQKEVQLEARARKLKESLKTGEVANNQISQQRDALQSQVAELKEQIEKLSAQHKSTVQDLLNQIKTLKRSLEEQKALTQQEEEQKQSLQTALTENKQLIEELDAKIIEFENNRPNPDLPTERELNLWADLQATKEILQTAEDEITTCKREKVRFLETMTKITENDSKSAMQQKLAAELLSKEEIIGKMQMQIRELTRSIKFNEQKVMQYEKFVQNLQTHNPSDPSNGYQDLQQEIMNLKMSLVETGHRNEELTELLMQKELQLEQQEKAWRNQAKVLKVREELINMLKNKETKQSLELTALKQDLEHRMNIVGEVNKQIAEKANEIQELFATLENKQQQIHRLEKIVHALEEQQRRAQAQRTRHEEKIAALEHELAANGTRHERLSFNC